jgi:hypothetical protein
LGNHHSFAYKISHLIVIGLGNSDDINRLWGKDLCAKHAKQLPLAGT